MIVVLGHPNTILNTILLGDIYWKRVKMFLYIKLNTKFTEDSLLAVRVKEQPEKQLNQLALEYWVVKDTVTFLKDYSFF